MSANNNSTNRTTDNIHARVYIYVYIRSVCCDDASSTSKGLPDPGRGLGLGSEAKKTTEAAELFQAEGAEEACSAQVPPLPCRGHEQTYAGHHRVVCDVQQDFLNY